MHPYRVQRAVAARGWRVIEQTRPGGRSGVGRIEYSWDDSSFVPFVKAIPVEKSGKQTVYYRSVDKVGNSEAVKRLDFVVDGRAGGEGDAPLRLGGPGGGEKAFGFARGGHGQDLRGAKLGRSIRSATSLRTMACCVSTVSFASMTLKLNSRLMARYCSSIRPWKIRKLS